MAEGRAGGVCVYVCSPHSTRIVHTCVFSPARSCTCAQSAAHGQVMCMCVCVCVCVCMCVCLPGCKSPSLKNIRYREVHMPQWHTCVLLVLASSNKASIGHCAWGIHRAVCMCVCVCVCVCAHRVAEVDHCKEFIKVILHGCATQQHTSLTR